MILSVCICDDGGRVVAFAAEAAETMKIPPNIYLLNCIKDFCNWFTNILD